MIGLISGAIIGSRFKDGEVPVWDFELFTDLCTFTGCTVLTLAQCFSSPADVPGTLLKTRAGR